MDRWCIFVPTIRKDIEVFHGALTRSLTYPSDVVILDGHEGIIQTYQWALYHALDPIRHAWWVKLDDDIILSCGWQYIITQAFEHIPNLGAASLDMSMTNAGQVYMGECGDQQEAAGVKYRVPKGNLAGGIITMRPSMALAVGVPPVVPGTKYQVYEDFWRCKQVRQMGKEIAYISQPLQPYMLHYNDDAAYLDKKKADSEASFNNRQIWG